MNPKQNRPKIKIQFDAKWLPYIAATVQGVLYSKAGKVYFGEYFTGSILGILPSLSIAFGSSRLAGVSAKERKAEARFFRNLLFVLSPLVVGPAIYIELEHLDYGNEIVTIVMKIIISLLVATVPDISIYFAGVIAGGSLMSLSEPQSEQSGSLPIASGSQSGQSGTQSRGSAGKPVQSGSKSKQSKSLMAACPFGCGKPLSAFKDPSGKIVPTTNALNAHKKHCPKAPKP